jgi:hypothetical protein
MSSFNTFILRTDSMSGRLSSLSGRLAKVEQQQADRARREELADCNCPALKSTLSWLVPIFPEPVAALEAELNRMCPVHGLRRFGAITIVNFVKPDGTNEYNTAKMHQLIDAHELLLSQYSQSNDEIEENES